MHFAEVPYTPILRNEVKWNSGITTAWLTSGTRYVIYCIERRQEWHFKYINNFRENTIRKIWQMFAFDSPCKSSKLPTFLRAHPPSSTLRSRLWTREAAAWNYTQKWIVITSIPGQCTWSVCNSCLVLTCQVKIIGFGIFATFVVSFRFALSVEHGWEIARPTAPATASTRHRQPEYSLFH